jgi:prevent-host-death family protein
LTSSSTKHTLELASYPGGFTVEMSVKEARSKLSTLLKQVEEGNEIVILRHGKKEARLAPTQGQGKRLPNLKDFRASIRIKAREQEFLDLQRYGAQRAKESGILREQDAERIIFEDR